MMKYMDAIRELDALESALFSWREICIRRYNLSDKQIFELAATHRQIADHYWRTL